MFHSPDYRSRYAEFLKIDFPRLPLTGNLELFRALGRLGGELTALHATGRVGQDIRTFVDEEPRSPVSRGQLGLRNDRASPRGPRRS